MDMYDRIQRQPARRQHITPGTAVLAAFGFLVAALLRDRFSFF